MKLWSRTYPKRTVRRVLAAAVSVGILGGLGLAYAADVRADVFDDSFIDALDSEGITYPSRAYAIRAAQITCAELDSGLPVRSVVLDLARESYLSVGDSAFFTGAAIAMYCPWHASQSYSGAWA